MRKTLFLFLFLFVAACSPKRDAEEFLPSENIYLSIDGGAMLGMIPLILLEDIEKETGKPIHQQIKGVMGTSTGAIVAGLITLPIINGKPATASEGLKFYKKAKEHAFGDQNVMERKFTEMLKHMNENLDLTFHDTKLSQARPQLQIATYQSSEPAGRYIFDSKKAKEDPNLDVKGSLAIRASISLVSIFGVAEFDFNGEKRTFIDLADSRVPPNDSLIDPTPLLYKYLKDTLPEGTKATIYSLGTGYIAGPSQQTKDLMAENSNIKIIRIDPDQIALREKIIKIFGEITNGGKAPEKDILNLLSSAVVDGGNGFKFDTMNTIEAVGKKLLESAEYKTMLDQLKNQKLIKVAK